MADAVAQEVVRKLIECGVYLYVENGELKFRAKKGAFSQQHKNQVKENKDAIIAYLLQIQARNEDSKLSLPPIEVSQEDGDMPLSFAQQRLWFVDQLEQGSAQYNMHGVFQIAGEFNLKAFEQTLASLLERHKVLCTHFVEHQGQAVQVVAKDAHFDYQKHDFSIDDGQDGTEQALQFNQLLHQQLNLNFDLSRDLMMRLHLIDFGNAQAPVVLYILHHIAGDAWSMGIFEREFNQLYHAYCLGQDNPLPPLTIQYGDYALWQRNWLQGETLRAQLDYWTNQLAGIPLKHSLALDKPRPARQTFDGKQVQHQLSKAMSDQIRTLCETQGVSLFMFLQTAFALLIGRFSNENDIVMGAATSGRTHGDIETLMGFFLNTLILRTDLSGNDDFTSLLQRNKKMILEAYEHQYLPFERLVEELNPERDLSHNAIVQILFGMQNNEQDLSAMSQSDQAQSAQISEHLSTRFDLKLDVFETGPTLTLTWLYNTSLFEDQTIINMADSFSVLLSSIIAQMSQSQSLATQSSSPQSVQSLNLLSDDHQQLMLQDWNQNEHALPDDACIHHRFEQQVKLGPDNIALIHDEQEMTYGELNQQANQLAHYLRQSGVKTDDLVALCVDRSAHMLVGLLGIIKAGGAYVPLDSEYPASRLDYMLKDCQANIIVTLDSLKNDIPHDKQQLICLDAPDVKAQLASQSVENPDIKDITVDNLIYVIYTSGSTGKPKGVLLSHKNVSAFLTQAVELFLPEHVVGAVVSSPLVFDATVGSLLVPLMAGKFAELLPEGIFALDRLSDCLADDEDAYLFKITPSHLEAVLANGYMQPNVDGRHVIVTGGELLKPANIGPWLTKLLPNSEFINEYGPTEATVGTTYYPLLAQLEVYNSKAAGVPIGRRFADKTMYVLNDELAPQGLGCIGELYIGGIGLARGYLSRADLTAERFVPNPFSHNSGERLYRTGDLVRYLDDGVLEFIGRVDHQVKIRGYRIELGEIESQLLQLDVVKEALVMSDPSSSNQQLVAYLVLSSTANDQDSTLSEIKATLSAQLPSFMVPEAYVVLAQMPLNTNSKIDRSALPAPGESHRGKSVYVAPANQTQHTLCQMWQTLLKLEQVGINDNFFALGGHSLMATRLVSQIRQTFAVEVTLKMLFDGPTVALLSEQLNTFSDAFVLPPIEPQAHSSSPLKQDKHVDLTLSFAQQRLWFLDQLGEGSVEYNVPGQFVLNEPLNHAAFEQALAALIERHQVLRSCFYDIDGQPHQKVMTSYQLPLKVHDLSALNDQDKTAEMEKIIRLQQQSGFDLSQDLMIRMDLVTIDSNLHVVLYTLHHIASDGWSLGLLQNEFNALYQAFSQGKSNPLAALPVQYSDYAHWQRQWLQGELLSEQLGYWQQQLAAIPPVHNLPLDKVRPRQQQFAGKLFGQSFDSPTSEQVYKLCQHHQVTLNMLLMSAFAIVIQRYSHEDDIVIGMPVAGRNHQDVEGLIGFFINTLVIRFDLSEDVSFEQLLQINKATILAADEHQHIPFEMLVEQLQPERHLGFNPLVQISFSVQNNEQGVFDQQAQSASQTVEQTQAVGLQQEVNIKLDLELYVTESNGQIHVAWGYKQSLFDDATIANMANSFAVLLTSIIADLSTTAESLPISQLQMLTAQQQNLLTDEVVDTQTEARRVLDAQASQTVNHTATNLVDLLATQALQSAERTAVMNEQQSLSYQQLHQRANQLAARLIEHGAGPKQGIGICVERSIDMLVSVLAVLKTGSYYIPLDPNYPLSRLTYIVTDSGLNIVISQSSLQQSLDLPQGLTDRSQPIKSDHLCCVLVDDSDSESATIDPKVSIAGSQCAYVLYTSGSTGLPKGVAVSHRSAVNFLTSMASEPGISADDRLLAVTTLSFDIALLEFLLPLTIGACVDIASTEGVQSGQWLSQRIEQNNITMMQATPVSWKLMLANGWQGNDKLVGLVGGEALPEDLVAQLQPKVKQLWNMYGPTETTVWSAIAPINCPDTSVTIGRPIANTQAYVLDDNLELLPQGAWGQLYLGGRGLAMGYVNQRALTATSFLPNPFSQIGGERLYATGDLVRLLANGELVYGGRIDQQVKLRGFRIELGEIEYALKSLDGIKDCAVSIIRTAYENNSEGNSDLAAQDDARLVGFIVPDLTDESLPNEQLQAKLSAQYINELTASLPLHMVPQLLVFLPALPLTPNGKLDRKALAVPAHMTANQSDYVPPSNDIETQLCQLWQQILTVEQVGIDDNFFALGGHSLLAARLINAIRQQFEIELPLRILFEMTSVRLLAKYIADQDDDQFVLPPITLVDRTKPLMLSYAQQRLWFIDQLGQGSVQFNTPGKMVIGGQFNQPAFERALKALLQRHEALRTCFSEVDGQACQMIINDFELPFVSHDVSDLTDEQKGPIVIDMITEQTNEAFDLSVDLMLRVAHIKITDDAHLIIYTMHHIASDGWSVPILQGELNRLYETFCQGLPNPLKPLKVQYADYAHWQRQWLSGDVLQQQLSYWQEHLAGVPPVHSVPLDKPRPAKQVFTGGLVHQFVDANTTAQIRALCASHNVTLYMLLQTAFALLLGRYSGKDDIVIGSPIAGRVHGDIEGLIGFFVNALILRTDLSQNPTFAALLQQNKQVILDAYAHQHVPFEMLVEALRPERHLNHNPITQISFAVHNHNVEGGNMTQQAAITKPTVQQKAPQSSQDNHEAQPQQFAEQVTTRVDLELHVHEMGDELNIGWLYNESLFEAATLERMAANFGQLLHSIIADMNEATTGHQPIDKLAIIADIQQQQLLTQWHSPIHRDAVTGTFVERFEAHAANTPDATALVFEQQHCRYDELNHKANQIAHYLRAQGVGPEVRVGVCVERSIEMIAGVLGVLKAGGCYVPMDPSYPSARLEYILAQSNCRLVLSERHLIEDLPFLSDTKVLPLDPQVHQAVMAKCPTTNIDADDIGLCSQNLAYVIYTSGSTGQPKGVGVTHQGWANLAENQINGFSIDSTSIVLQFASLSFDAAASEIAITLGCGATLCLLNEADAKSTERLTDILNQQRVSHATLPPALLNYLEPQSFPLLTTLIVAGEAISTEAAQLWSTGRKLINAYGPSETTVCATLGQYDNRLVDNKPSIGYALPNMQVYVLDSSAQLCPVGALGELYVGGVQLARGYLSRADLTAERFVPNPFASDGVGGERLYRTGDLVRYLNNGQLEFIGRIDHQVKVRGFRIELGEIEAKLVGHRLIQDAALSLQTQTDNEAQLVAYVCPTQDYLAEASEQLNQSNLDQWTHLFDDQYVGGDGGDEGDEDFSGWLSSYTGKAIALSQMRQWRDQTMERIVACQPKRILEVGCGTGLLLHRYSEHCDKVHAIDISAVALANIQRQLDRKGWTHVTLQRGDALCTEELIGYQFDTIVMNSVVQYFSNPQYFEQVIDQLLDCLAPGGKIMLGDIRNLDLLPAHCAAIERSRLNQATDVNQLASLIQRRMQQEPEFLLSPSYVSRLPEIFPAIGRVDIMVKAGDAQNDNEMVRYRYEIILHKGSKAATQPDYQTPLQWFDFSDFDELERLIKAQPTAQFAVSGVPNGRVSDDVIIANGINQTRNSVIVQPQKVAGELSESAIETINKLNGLLALAEQLGYQSAMTWSQNQLNQLDIIFGRERLPQIQARCAYQQSYYYNYPQLSEVGQMMSNKLKDYLSEHLPEYMLPNVYIPMEYLPLTPSGKIDKKALPKPQQSDLKKEAYVAPRNDTERTLCELLQELLGVERVGVFDNFFAIGGHSLLGMRLVSLIRDAFGAEVPLRLLFETPNVVGLSECISRAETVPTLPPVEPVSRSQVLPLSFAQQRLWFIDQLGQGSVQFNMASHFLVQGTFDISAFEKALNSLIERHEVLRTQYVTEGDEARLHISQQFELPLEYHDISQGTGAESEQLRLAKVQQLVAAEKVKPFDLSADLMLRVQLLKLSQNEHLIVYSMHHIASDGWSLGILQKELSALYQAYSQGLSNPLPTLKVQYADFALWQRNWLTGEVLEQALDYWREQLANLPAVHSLTLDKPRSVKQRFKGKSHNLFIGPQLTNKINQFIQSQDVTLFMFMHSAMSVLLSRYSGETDIVVGSASAGRAHHDVEGLIGFFINDLVLRTDLSGQPNFATLLQQSKQTILDAYSNQHIPFEMLVETLNPERSMSHSPLFQIKLDVQNTEQVAPISSELEFTDLRQAAQQKDFKNEQEHTVKHDLYLNVSEVQDGMSLSWVYCTELFYEQTIEQMSVNFNTLLDAIVDKPQRPIDRLPLLTFEQQNELLLAHSGAALSSNDEQTPEHTPCLHQRIAEQAAQTPDSVALEHQGELLSYQQLNQQANQLAHYLLAQGVKPDTLVGLCIERSFDMVVAMLAVLKAGGAYMPMDPSTPQARIDHILADSGARCVLTHSELLEQLSFDGDGQSRKILPVELSMRQSLLARFSIDDPVIEGLTTNHLAYMIYTSGSTGLPKGVMVEHQGVLQYCLDGQSSYFADDLAGSVVATSYSFDLTVPSIYLPLLAGKPVMLLDEGSELEQLAQLLIVSQHAVLLRITPSHIDGFITLMAGQSSHTEHVLVIGGEPLALSTIKALRQILPQARLFNHYGPTEAIVGCSIYPISQDLTDRTHCPIGQAMGHSQLLVLNEAQQLNPIGVPGQLYIGGSRLARGYFNDSELTAQKFIDHPFASNSKEQQVQKLYQSGDLARYRHDGQLEFIGRIDNQVKIRGLRIELGEIEKCLLALDGIVSCAVDVQTTDSGNDSKHLVGYVVLEQTLEDTVLEYCEEGEEEAAFIQAKQQLIQRYRETLGKHLPAYMVPQIYLFLSELPLTYNGKLDRKQLPQPEEGDLLKSQYIAPTNEVERTLCQLWQEVLNIEQIGIEDDFFLMGGHSLIATRLINLIRREFEIELELRVLFDTPTINEMAKAVMIAVFNKKSLENEQAMAESDDDTEEVDL